MPTESLRNRARFASRPFAISLLVVAVALLSLSCGGGATLQPPPTKGFTLVWSDEFTGPDGSSPDSSKWTFDTGVGGNGWGNNEFESYTNRTVNAQLKGGNLVITALKETYADPSDNVTRNYTSSRMKTQGLFNQAYGRFEAASKFPRGRECGRLSGC